jgi:quercetin dioxygenase-like cupin family protein
MATAQLVDPSEAETINVLGPTIEYITAPTGGDHDPCVMRGTIPPGVVVPLHSHPDPETFLVFSGEVEALTFPPDSHRWVPVRAGDFFHVPGDVRHAWRNVAAQPAVMLIVSTAKLGRFFREVADEPLQRFLEIAERYGYWNATPEENAAVGLRLT